MTNIVHAPKSQRCPTCGATAKRVKKTCAQRPGVADSATYECCRGHKLVLSLKTSGGG